ncbi:MAG: adenylate/guanylate cyclase domain-containing protein [Leptospiraceae bacterium]|nr:adenylate/guanylate cyclase domain-containing protein [Leptospiraceae bacterium]
MKVIHSIFGDPHLFTVEHRLFNILTLVNGLLNFGNILALDFDNYARIILLNAGIGLVFIGLFFISRLTGSYRVLYWPFMLSMLAFLMINIILNAGSLGGTQYYLITALVIGTILGKDRFSILTCYVLFGLAVVALFVIENWFGELIVAYKSPDDRVWDVFGNFFFVQMLTSGIVWVMSGALNSERGRSDRLLLNILPDQIAGELKLKDSVKPLQYDQATVLFTDFVGFTRIAEKLSPEELVQELDHCFRFFDEVMQRHRMEKIKTIGDAYMAVGGIPEANGTNPVDAILAALEIQAFMQELNERHSAAGAEFWQMRIGIHTGPLVAGVIGTRKFAYDVWGDAVNLASRMESSGAPGAVNISGYTYELVHEFFDMEHRGKIEAKNKGKVDMYFVKAIRPELTEAANPANPNLLFRERYHKLETSSGSTA